MMRPASGFLLLAFLAALAGCSGSLPTIPQIEAAPPEGLETVRETLESRLEKDPGDPELLFLSASVLLQLGEVDEAETRALWASSRWLFDGPLTELLGRIYLAQNRRFRALTAFSQAIEFDPELLSAYVNLAITHDLLGQTELAKVALREAIGREARYFPAQYHLARIFFEANETVAAARAVIAARAIRPDDPEARLLEIRIAKAGGQFTIALFMARETLELYPGFLDAQREVVDIHVQRREWEKAAGILAGIEERGELEPEDAVVKVEVLRALRRPEEAQQLLDWVMSRHPDHPEVLLAQAKLHLLQNDPAAAIRVLERSVEQDPRSAMAHYWSAMVHFRLGALTLGDSALASAVRLAPDDGRIKLLQARREMARGNLGFASSLLNQHLAQFPADGNALLIKSELLTLQGQYTAAQNHLDELAPGESESALRFARARLAYLRGAFQEVLEHTGAVVENPDAPWQLVYLHAAALGRLQLNDEASALLSGRLSSREGGAAFHRLAGELERLAGNPAAAERIFEEGLDRFPRDPELLERASGLAIERGRLRKALGWLLTAVELPGPFRLIFLERMSLVYTKLGEPGKSREVLSIYLAETDPLLGERRHFGEKGVLFGSAFPAVGYGLRPPVPIKQTSEKLDTPGLGGDK